MFHWLTIAKSYLAAGMVGKSLYQFRKGRTEHVRAILQRRRWMLMLTERHKCPMIKSLERNHWRFVHLRPIFHLRGYDDISAYNYIIKVTSTTDCRHGIGVYVEMMTRLQISLRKLANVTDHARVINRLCAALNGKWISSPPRKTRSNYQNFHFTQDYEFLMKMFFKLVRRKTMITNLKPNFRKLKYIILLNTKHHTQCIYSEFVHGEYLGGSAVGNGLEIREDFSSPLASSTSGLAAVNWTSGILRSSSSFIETSCSSGWIELWHE